MEKMCRKPDLFMRKNVPQARLIEQNGTFFDWILMDSLFYLYSM